MSSSKKHREKRQQRRKNRTPRSRPARDVVMIPRQVHVPRPNPEVLAWPVIRAYVPIEEAWQATGLGTAGVIREKPNGKWVIAFFWLSLMEDGLVNLFGDDDTTPEAVTSLLEDLGTNIPPMQEGSIDQAAAYVWGAYVLSQTQGITWPPGELNRYLSLVPTPPGTSRQWRQRFIGPNGLTPDGLLNVIRRNRPPADVDIPEGKEIAIFTRMVFQLDDAPAVTEQLRRRTDFVYTGHEGEMAGFDWVRDYPRGHWSPFRRLGGQQVLGSVNVESDTLTAEVKTLSMGARLVAILKEMFGEQIRLQETAWQGMQEMLSRASDAD
jgi:hypothetical protein